MTTDSKAVCGGGEADLLTFLDGLAENAAPDQRKPLNPILIGMNASAHADRIRSTALASTAGAGSWRPMDTAPSNTPIVARHKPNNRTPHGWVATISRAPEDPDERVGGLDTILHYNGDALKRGFHGVWVGWMYPEEFAALALSAGTLSVGWDGARDAFARIVEERAWTAEHGEPRAACLRAASDIRQAKAPAVPASPRSGAGEKVDQALLRELSDLADWLERDSSENDADNVRAAVSALSQGGGAGRSEKGEGEEEGRVPSGTGSHPTGEAATASSSPSDIDPSRGWIPYEHKDYDPRPDVDWTGYSHEEASSGPAIACEDYTGEPLFLVWWSDFGQGVSRITAWRPLPAELAPPAPDIVAQAIKARRAKTQGGFVADESAVHAVDAPCHWGGGNDIIWCSTCGAQYAYAKGEERPPCPRSAAPAQSPSTSDREG